MADPNQSGISSDLANATFAKLSESIIQQNALSINSVVVPEFNGHPSEDAIEFVTKFKLTTLGFSDTHKCLLINRALKESAYIWAQSSIKEELIKSDWQVVEKKFIERFGPIDKKLYYLEKMKQSMFEPDRTTLISYVERYLSLYKKAYVTYQVNDAIYSLRCNLPDSIIKGLNSLDDNWINYDNFESLLSLVSRYERNILAFDKKDPQSQTVSPDTIKNMIEDLKSKFLEEHKIKKEPEENPKGLAVISHQTPSKPIEESKFQYIQPQTSQDRPNYKRAFKSYNRYHMFGSPDRTYKQNYNSLPKPDSGKRPRNDERVRENSVESSRQKEQSQHRYNQRQQDKVNAYYAKYGSSYSECRYCKGKHLNRHCPLLKEDLN